MSAKRHRSLVVMVDDSEHAMAHALAAALEEPIAVFVRRAIAEAYAARFGVQAPLLEPRNGGGK